MSDYLWDRDGPPDPEIARLERALGRFAQSVPPPPMRVSTPMPWPRRTGMAVWVLLAEAAAIVACAGLGWWASPSPHGGLAVTRLAGTPTIGSQALRDTHRMTVGGWLDTGDDGRVSIDVGGIGRLEIAPASRLGLVSTRTGDYRLRLARGTMSALIWAPPGQFSVETPTSTAVNLGCAYTLTVDEDGGGLIRVLSGWVGFDWRGREAFIPAGAMCLTRPALGPGTPHFEETSAEFKLALETIDLGRGSADVQAAALERVLTEAQPRDAVTLWHLLSRVAPDERGFVFDRLGQYIPPPASVTREGIRSGNREMLDRWWDALGFGGANWWRAWKQPWREGR